ncbi:MAG: M23 family metallopeptidase [Novosphingobium sp.]
MFAGAAALALGIGQISGLGARAAEALGLVSAPDFALSGELTQGGWARGIAPPGTAALMLGGKPVGIAADGRFLIAFDRDAGPSAQLVARLDGGRSAVRSLAIAPRAWQLEHIPLGPRSGTPPNPAFALRRNAELAQINAARAVDHDVQGWRQRFIWPVYGRISGRFGSQRIYNGTPGSYHSGMDIATGTSGTPFVAPADGVVILAADSPFTLEGRLLMIDHGMGLNSAFLHSSRLAVKVGDVVRQGQYLGNIGMTGRATGPHLHWSVKWRDSRLDPLLFTGPMPGR